MTALVEQLELAERVGRLHLRGQNATQIARELEIPRKDVTRALEDFRGLLRQNAESAVDIRERLLDIVYESDETFRLVADEAWKTVEEAGLNGQLAVKVNALKLVESTTKNRAVLAQDAGASQDNDLIEQLNQREENERILVALLREISQSHPEVSELIARQLSKVTGGEVEVEEIHHEQAAVGDGS